MRILVNTLQNYTHQSGGIHVLHYFAYLAAKLGHDAITSHETKPAWRKHVQECLSRCHVEHADVILRPESDSRTCPKTVRWILARPGWLPTGGPRKFAHYEPAFWFTPDLEAPTRAACETTLGELFLPSIDPHDWPEFSVSRTHDAFYVGKAAMWGPRNWKQHVPATNPLEVTRSWPRTKPELSQILHMCRRFYSFDDYSGILHEARMCGCEVLVWNEEEAEWKECLNDWAPYVMNEERDLRTVESALDLMQRWKFQR